ncbi:MAG: tetratricopeptide repeat protein [Candidatus Poribacteria bacterium]|nr:tetratricopeptide repeat protein [Candidatus Poribacteria bacterium]
MTCSKLSLFFLVLMLITVVTFVVQLEPEEIRSEEKHAAVQEFVKLAQGFVKRNQIEEAIKIYERIVIALPEDTESRTQLAELYTRTNQHEKAAQIWGKLLEGAPENLAYQDELVKSWQAAGKVNEALELAQSYIQTHPEFGVHYARLAKLYADEDNVDAAIANYEKAIELGQGDKQTYLILARLYFFNEDIDATEIALKNAIQSTTSNSERQEVERQLLNFYRYHGILEERLQKAEAEGTITYQMQRERARLFIKNSELEKSADAFEKALEMTNSTNEKNKVTEELLKAYLKHNRTDLALEFYEAEVSKHPRLVTHSTTFGASGINVNFVGDDTRKTLINVYRDKGKLEELVTIFEGKLGKDTKNTAAIEMLADTYWETNDFQKAAEVYDMLSKVEPDNVRSFYYAAAAFKKRNQPDIMKTVLNRADTALTSSKFKGDTSFVGALATICLKNGIYDQSIKLAAAAVVEAESSGDKWELQYLYAILAKSYLGAKRYEDAFVVFQQMAKATNSRLMQVYAENKMKKIAKDEKPYEKLIPEQLKNVEDNPSDFELILELAESYEATDKIKQAIEQYQKLTKLQPENVRWHIKLGDLFQRVDRPVDAIIESNALSLDGNGSYVEIEDSELINNISEQVTVSTWIKPTDFPNTYTTVLFKGDKRIPDISHRQFTLWLFDGGRIIFNVSPGGQSQKFIWSPPNSIAKNKWCHVAATVDAKKNIMKFYLNGSEVGRNDFKQAKHLRKTTLPFRIGCSHEEERWEHASFAGLLDEVRIWNIARTAEQIRSDMNKQLNGDEAGLVGYWKFDVETQGRVSDSSPNENDGKLIGNAKLEPYTRPILANLKNEYLTKSVAYYEKAIELNPEIYQSYDLLANLYIKQNQIFDAEAVYLQALDTPSTQARHDSLIRAISALYTDEAQEHKLLAILEEIEPKLQESVVLHELLGDLYKKTGDSDKAEIVNAQWLKIRQKDVNLQSENYQRWFAEELLDKGIFPETALKYAKRALQDDTGTSYHHPMTLGRACVANGLYDEALRNYKYALSIMSANSSLDYFWKKVADASKNAKNKERYNQMLAALKNSILPEYSDLAPMVSE